MLVPVFEKKKFNGICLRELANLIRDKEFFKYFKDELNLELREMLILLYHLKKLQ